MYAFQIDVFIIKFSSIVTDYVLNYMSSMLLNAHHTYIGFMNSVNGGIENHESFPGRQSVVCATQMSGTWTLSLIWDDVE